MFKDIQKFNTCIIELQDFIHLYELQGVSVEGGVHLYVILNSS
jgi:hypothetical protein